MSRHDESYDLVIECLEVMGCATGGMSPTSRLDEDLGLDSIEIVELVALTLKRSGLPLGSVHPGSVDSVHELVQRLRQATAGIAEVA